MSRTTLPVINHASQKVLLEYAKVSIYTGKTFIMDWVGNMSFEQTINDNFI